jgi:hypothetical protein
MTANEWVAVLQVLVESDPSEDVISRSKFPHVRILGIRQSPDSTSTNSDKGFWKFQAGLVVNRHVKVIVVTLHSRFEPSRQKCGELENAAKVGQRQ